MVRFRTNQVFEKNRQGKKGIGLGLVYPSAESIEIIGMLGGFDFINLDGEHGLFSPESIDAMCRVADGFGLTVTARVPNIRASTINQFLDRGVHRHFRTAHRDRRRRPGTRRRLPLRTRWSTQLGRRTRHVLQQHPAARRPR